MNSAFGICTLRNSVSVVALATALAAPAVLLPSGAGAGTLPTNGRYIAGSGSIHGAGNGLTIDQSSTRGIIDWQSFSIGQGQTVQFDNGSGATLNEVTGNNLSQIAGSLTATGSVYLVNPEGIIVTPTGQVITQGSFVASTRNVDSANFMAGSGIQVSGSSSGNVTNEGNITSANGDVVLFGNNARSAGGSNTDAANGTVAVIAGNSILYQPGSNSQILVKGGKGKATNHGSIRAAQAELAAAGGNVYAMAGNNGGSIQATGTSTIAGHVWLTAGGETSIAGSVTAKNANGSGGTIVATGNSVDVGNNATVSADGTTGGTVLIGGDEHGGSDPSADLVSQYVPDAQTTTVESSATISANGTDGAGGNIVLWSQKETRFKGKVNAQGSHGAAGGNAEVSSHEVLDFKGHVNLLSPGGATGNLLLDPSNVVISEGSNQGEEEQQGLGGLVFTPTAYDSVLNVNTLEETLNDANVTVTTQSNQNSAGNITVAVPLTWSKNLLTLSAYGSVFFDSTVSATGTAGLAINYNQCNCNANYFFSGGNITFQYLTESLTINGAGYTLEDTVQGLASAINANSGNDFALANSYNASGDGTYSTVPVPTTLGGIFAGLGNSISNLWISDSTDTSVGLFATLASGGTIRDLALISPSVSGVGGKYNQATEYVGALVGSSSGLLFDDTVTDATVSLSDIVVTQYIGGLVGTETGGMIEDSAVTGNTSRVTEASAGDTAVFVGGLAGSVNTPFQNQNSAGTIANSYSNAYVDNSVSDVTTYVGGLVGYDYGSVSNSYATGEVYSLNQVVDFVNVASYVGGLIGQQYGGSVSGSYATGGIQSNGSGPSVTFSGGTGGLIGDLSTDNTGNGGSVTTSFATGQVVLDANGGLTGGYEGGLVGSAGYGTSISTSYATGSVTGYAAAVGGLVGLNSGTISQSSAGQNGSGPLVQSGYETLVNNVEIGADVGGLVGENTSFGTISQSFAAQREGSSTNAIVGGDYSYVGGLAGYNNGLIENSYSYPAYSNSCTGNNCFMIYGGSSSSVGGLVGYEDSSAQILSSYSTGSVGSSNSGSLVGGSIGYDYGLNNESKQYVYWDTDTSGTGYAAGNGGGSSDYGISPETTAQLGSGLPAGLGNPTWYEISGVNTITYNNSTYDLPCLAGVTGGCGD